MPFGAPSGERISPLGNCLASTGVLPFVTVTAMARSIGLRHIRLGLVLGALLISGCGRAVTLGARDDSTTLAGPSSTTSTTKTDTPVGDEHDLDTCRKSLPGNDSSPVTVVGAFHTTLAGVASVEPPFPGSGAATGPTVGPSTTPVTLCYGDSTDFECPGPASNPPYTRATWYVTSDGQANPSACGTRESLPIRQPPA